MTKIGEMAFYGCNGLKEINISESVLSIGTAAFANCENLENIFVDAKIPSIIAMTEYCGISIATGY